MSQDIIEQRKSLGTFLHRAERIVILTGAGISTECGVPDFRSPDTPWKRYPPIGFADFMASPEVRAEAWRRKFAMDDLYAGAKPGRTHKAITQIDRAGRLGLNITQNIDGLQQATGLPADRLVELHGNGTYATCLSCGTRYELADIRSKFEQTGEAPVCSCGGPVKSATIAFGQGLPAKALQRAQWSTEDCDLFLVLGSSLMVKPAATLPLIAKRNGSALVIINREATRLDDYADLVLGGDVGTILEPWSESF